MKMVISIVQDDDTYDVVDGLTEKGFRVTRLATTGGFLKSGNTTLLVGVEEKKVEEVITVIKDICKKRKEIVASPTPFLGNSEMYLQYPIEVQVGGATIFVLDVDQFLRI